MSEDYDRHVRWCACKCGAEIMRGVAKICRGDIVHVGMVWARIVPPQQRNLDELNKYSSTKALSTAIEQGFQEEAGRPE